MNPTSSVEGSAATPRRRQWLRVAALAMALLALYATGVGLRRHVLRAQRPDTGAELPFTLESALQYRLTRMAFAGAPIPRHDPDLQVPDGVRTFAVDTTGAEVAVGRLARVFPSHMTLAERVRWIHVFWFCMGIPFMAAWIRRETGSWTAGLAAGAIYATAISAVVRSTGQEISHENMALPLLIAHLWAAAQAWSRRRAGRSDTAWSLAAGLLLALALATWDMVQFYTVPWALARLVAWLRRPAGPRMPRVRHDLIAWGALALGGLGSPYLRTHGFLLSPTMLAGYGVAAGAAWLATHPAREGAAPLRVARILALAPLLLLVAPFARPYRESYGHFGELLWAKLRFLNQKPEDPALLTFYQRIMWTPALHSATWYRTGLLFPAFLLLTSGASVVCWGTRVSGNTADLSRRRALVVLWAVSFAAFVLFVRFHVFVALFGSAVVGLATARFMRGSRRASILPILLVGATVAVEAGVLIRRPRDWGRHGVYYDQLDSLAAWLRHHADRQPVLAPFGVGGTVLAYGHCPILLHPKFESPDIRQRVQTYGELLFGRDEDALRDWAEAHHAVYLIVEAGQFTGRPDFQMRYFVNALDFSPERLAWRLETADPSLRRFRLLWSNAVYRVYRIVRTDDEETWWFRRGAAQDALREGRLDEAERHAMQALQIVTDDAESMRVIARVTALRQAGFRGEAPP